ncbi:MAG TPA: SDR family NAD(P)-dependent oxidoreductase, partial [Myxococcaceae bacterium]
VRAVLPGMRERGGGWLVNVSSLAGLIGIPFQSMYSASKFAIEGWSEALRLELAPFGIRVVLVEPGDVKTGFTGNRVRARLAGQRGPYQEAFQRALGVMEADEQRGPGPEVVSRAVSAILRSRSPRLRYRVGDAFQCASVGLRHWLPARLVEWGLGKYYKLA